MLWLYPKLLFFFTCVYVYSLYQFRFILLKEHFGISESDIGKYVGVVISIIQTLGSFAWPLILQRIVEFFRNRKFGSHSVSDRQVKLAVLALLILGSGACIQAFWGMNRDQKDILVWSSILLTAYYGLVSGIEPIVDSEVLSYLQERVPVNHHSERIMPLFARQRIFATLGFGLVATVMGLVINKGVNEETVRSLLLTFNACCFSAFSFVIFQIVSLAYYKSPSKSEDLNESSSTSDKDIERTVSIEESEEVSVQRKGSGMSTWSRLKYLVLKVKEFPVFLFLTLVIGFNRNLLNLFGPLYIKEQLNLSSSISGLSLMVMSLTEVVGYMIISTFMGRKRGKSSHTAKVITDTNAIELEESSDSIDSSSVTTKTTRNYNESDSPSPSSPSFLDSLSWKPFICLALFMGVIRTVLFSSLERVVSQPGQSNNPEVIILFLGAEVVRGLWSCVMQTAIAKLCIQVIPEDGNGFKEAATGSISAVYSGLSSIIASLLGGALYPICGPVPLFMGSAYLLAAVLALLLIHRFIYGYTKRKIGSSKFYVVE